MNVIKSDLFELHEANPNCSICIPTSGIVKPNGELVMGASLALEAQKRFPVIASLFSKAPKNTVYKLSTTAKVKYSAFRQNTTGKITLAWN